jgi:PIN domain nuclease of toxin-antitoxin system
MNRLLLDTHVLLWLLGSKRGIGAATQALMNAPGAVTYFSAASIWEIAIKFALGRADFAVRPDEIATAAGMSGLIELPVRASAAARVANLPLHHRDPFDRVLVAQAIDETARLLTVDPQLARYSDLVMLIR